MASICKGCGKKMSFLSMSSLCLECKEKTANRKIEESEAEKILSIEKDLILATIFSSKYISDQQLDLLRKLKKKSALEIYNAVYSGFINDSELEYKELETLQKIQSAANLSSDDVSYKENVLPYAYVCSIKIDGKLPSPEVEIPGAPPILLKKGEIIHFGDIAVLKEKKTVSLGYKGGSRGVSIRIMKGVSYRVGAHRGHVLKEEQLVEVSSGVLIISNQRLYLHPYPGHKPASIPLNNVLSYNCYKDVLEIYKDGREKGYFFNMNSGSVEVAGICLNFLLSNR